MHRIGFVLLAMVTMLGLGSAAGALSSTDLDSMARIVSTTGRFLEFSSNDDLDSAIDDANERRIAFVWLDADGDGEAPAEALANRLEGSAYRSVVVLTNTSIGAYSSTGDDASMQRALDASGDDFAAGEVADGLRKFTSELAGDGAAATTATTTSGSEPTSSSSGGGIGLGTILLVALLGGGGFLLVRNMRARSKAKKQASIDLEADRAEIKEQLRDNADHVLALGDRVIAAGKPDLMTSYEQASTAYQEVSGSIDAATTAEEIDRLDDLIDNAEWQFESIEAELEGRPAPPSPAEVEAQAEAESAGPTPPAPSQDDGQTAPAPSREARTQAPRQQMPNPGGRRRSGGGLGSILGGILGSIVLGGGGRGGMGGMGGMGSRRSQRRRSQIPGGGGSMGGGGLGGGVLRPRGSSRSGSSRRGSSGSRSIRRGSGGSRSF